MCEFQGNFCKRIVRQTNAMIYEVVLKGSMKKLYGSNLCRFVQEGNKGIVQMGGKEYKAPQNH